MGSIYLANTYIVAVAVGLGQPHVLRLGLRLLLTVVTGHVRSQESGVRSRMITGEYSQPDLNVQVSALEEYFVQVPDDPAVTVTDTFSDDPAELRLQDTNVLTQSQIS